MRAAQELRSLSASPQRRHERRRAKRLERPSSAMVSAEAARVARARSGARPPILAVSKFSGRVLPSHFPSKHASLATFREGRRPLTAVRARAHGVQRSKSGSGMVRRRPATATARMRTRHGRRPRSTPMLWNGPVAEHLTGTGPLPAASGTLFSPRASRTSRPGSPANISGFVGSSASAGEWHAGGATLEPRVSKGLLHQGGDGELIHNNRGGSLEKPQSLIDPSTGMFTASSLSRPSTASAEWPESSWDDSLSPVSSGHCGGKHICTGGERAAWR